MNTAPLLLIALLAAVADEPPPAVDANIQHAPAARLGDELLVRIYVMNQTDDPQAVPRVLALRLEALSGEGGRAIPLPELESRLLEGRGQVTLELTVPLAKRAKTPGSFRFVFRLGEREVEGRRFRVAETLDPPDWIHLTYSVDREKAVLGEPVTVRFTMTNEGDEPFPFEEGGDYRGATRHLRHCFTAVRAGGLRAVDPTPEQACFGGLGMFEPELAPGESYEKELPLLAYLRFAEPGIYTVTGWHALGFGRPVEEPKGQMYGAYARGGAFTIEILPAPPESRRAVLEAILAEPDGAERRNRLSRIYDAAYLPDLLGLLAEETDPELGPALVVGIGSIPDAEATSALVRLAADPRAQVRGEAFREILPRLPEGPRLTNDAGGARDEAQRAPLLAALRAALLSPEPETVRLAAWAFARLGAAAAVELIASAAERLAPALPVPEETARAVDSLGEAAAALAAFGPRPVVAGEGCSPGRLVVWAMLANVRPEARGESWEALILSLTRSPSPLLNAAALRRLPTDFGRRWEIPWGPLLASPELTVWWYALQAARADPPQGIREIVRGIFATTDDLHKTGELTRFLEELGE